MTREAGARGPGRAAPAGAAAASRSGDDGAPAWIHRFVWRSLWKTVAVGIIATLGILIFIEIRHVLAVLVISLFFALAIIPGVEALTTRYPLRRGAAVGIIFLAATIALVLMIAFLVPAIVTLAEQLSSRLVGWMADLDRFSRGVIDQDAAVDAASPLLHAIQQWGDNIFGVLSSGLGLAFDVFTILTFTFYFAADFPRLMRAVMRRIPPERQQFVQWLARTSIEQTAGYFYSRLLLMFICGTGALFVMLLAGLPLVYAMPLALFMGFTSEFIPFIGTYLGAILPSIVMLAVQGVLPTLILLAYVVIYQQVENYVLNPKLSSKTMELNGAVAFGGAMVGAAIAGPMGAFMALPVAALITVLVTHSGRTYPLAEDGDAHEAPA
ncbi:AI-2E family transporter [Demequina aestuarii]|uniref:AI-2E family transporter n=1 Tax=Demequina aestuarii TaxID=327095 RepID=UPI0007818F53|nr:AI-2E family transporter [Demequina aestuarii]